MKYKIVIDRRLCIGCATCVSLAPKTFALDNQGKAVLLPTKDEETEETILAVAESCPVAAITLIDEKTGKKAWPN